MRESVSSSSDRIWCAVISAVGGAAGPKGPTSASNRLPGPAVVAEGLGLLAHRLAQPAQQRGAAREAHQRIDLADLEGVAQPVGHQARRPAASACSGWSGSDEKSPLVNAWKLATPSPSERV
jgi:hypothetical protein